MDALYPHLSEDQRTSLTKQLIAPDKHPASQGTYKQIGQRKYALTLFTQSFLDPQNLKEAMQVFKFGRFRPISMDAPEIIGDEKKFTFNGKQGATMEFTISLPPSDAELIQLGREQLNNPDKFTWTVQTNLKNGKGTKKVIAKRVVAYLHHGSLDAAKDKRFMPAQTDARFFANSQFSPPPPVTP
ncbi:MAG: hypothetical protein ABIQ93_16720 [Saprospiraceae bacterium]